MINSSSKSSARPATRKMDPTSANDPNPEPTLKRRHTATPTQMSLSRRTSCETTTNYHLFSARSSTASNKDGCGSSCSTNSRSTTTNRTSLLMPPAASSPSTPAANKAMRSIESWKLVPQELYLQTPPMPSLIYGPIHLLRLFVKLPEILGRMNLPPKTCKLIVKYMDAVIEYFEGHPDLFASEMYE
jgi:male-specific lethal 3